MAFSQGTVTRDFVLLILNDPAIQTLLVRKLVEAARDPLDGTIRVMTKMHYADPGKVVIELLDEELLAVLLPTRGPDHG